MGLELLIPIVVPFATELVKRLWGLTLGDAPPAIVPAVAAGVGAALGAVPELGSTIPEGIAFGLAGVGLHQVGRVTGLTRRAARTRATD